MASMDGNPVSLVSEHSETVRRIEEMLATLMAKRRAPPTPDPPDSFRSRQISEHQPQPINDGGQTYTTRYEFPKFNGTLISDWIWRCEQLFYLNRTPPELMVHQASLHFEGKALQWHLDYIRNRYGLYPSWPDYMIDISAQFGRNWDSGVRECNQWVGLSAWRDEIDCNVQSISDLKDYGLAYTPMVIDDNQMVVKELADPIAHQVLDEMSVQKESKEIEQAEEIAQKQEVEELKESSELSQEEQAAQIGVEVVDIAATGNMESSAYKVFDEMSMLFDEVIELSDAVRNESEMSIDDMVGQETSPFSWDGLKGKLKINEVAGSNIDEDKLAGHEGDLCFDPGGDYQVVSKNGHAQKDVVKVLLEHYANPYAEINENIQLNLKELMAGNFSIDSNRILSVGRELGNAHAIKIDDDDELLSFDPGGTFLIVAGYSLLRLLPRPRGYGSMVAKDFISEVAHQVLDKMFAPIESTQVGNRSEMNAIRAGLFDLFQLQPVFDPGITAKWIEVNVATLGKTSTGSAMLLLLTRGLRDVRVATSDGDRLICFDPGGKWSLISAKCEIKEVASMSDGDPNQRDEGLMLTPRFLSINQPRLGADGLLGIYPDIEKCIEWLVFDPGGSLLFDLDPGGAFSFADNSFNLGFFTSKKRDLNVMDVDPFELVRTVEVVPGEGFKDSTQKLKAIKMAKNSVNKRNKSAHKGEGERVIPTLKPKHLYSGKRSSGKTDRR